MIGILSIIGTLRNKAIGLKRYAVRHLRYSPYYDKVKNDPRFPEIFRKVGLPY